MTVQQQGIAVVVGGGSGIGLAAAQGLASLGQQVVIAGRRPEVLAAACRTSHAGPPLQARATDATDRRETDALFQWVEDSLGPVAIVVHAAGINIPQRTMADMPPEDWDRVLTINATGAYNVFSAALPAMRRRRQGLIICVNSVAGKRAAPLGGVAYNASKFALAALATSIAEEERAQGIRVTSIFPGEVNTPILDQRPVPLSAEHRRAILQPDDFVPIFRLLATLPPHVHLPELVIKPLHHSFV